MTVPVTGLTPIFGIEYLVQGEPLRNTRAKLERNAKTVEAALQRGAASPPAAQDLLTVVGRVTTLEGQPVLAPVLKSPWAVFDASRTPLRVWTQGRTAQTVGFLTVASTVAAGATAGAQQVVQLVAPGGLPPLYRPSSAGWDVSGTGIINGTTPARIDVLRDGSMAVVLAAPFSNGFSLSFAFSWPTN